MCVLPSVGSRVGRLIPRESGPEPFGIERRAHGASTPGTRDEEADLAAAPPIGDYGLLADCNGAALVSRTGSIDWWCAPRFDSPSLLGRILDPDAGHWEIGPDGPAEATRAYLEGTFVLRTTFTTAGGEVTITDALALQPGARGHGIGLETPRTLVRVVRGVRGRVAMRMDYAPRPEYGLVRPELVRADGLVVSEGGAGRLLLRSDVDGEIDGPCMRATMQVAEGQVLGFALHHQPAIDEGREVLDPREAVEDTADAWRSWAEMHTAYDGYRAADVRRSALVLQALTYAPTGAIVAAPTTSIPEEIGGEKNWDYRYAWLRDAALTMHALWVAACPDEAARNFAWMARVGVGAADGTVQIVYGVEGERDLTEHELDHLRGHRDSAPVRVGNAAWRQRQLDVPGQVLASAHMLRDQLDGMDGTTRRFLADLADIAAESWGEPDSGIWEGREGERDYLNSKVMCWVALDRALDLADCLGAGDDRRAVWARERDAVRAAVLARGWSEQAGAYAGAFDSDRLDASVLLMPIVGFLPADDERMLATIQAVEDELTTDGLVRRWTGAEDGPFLLCSFWLADCLALAGRTERAIEVFEAAAAAANDLGLMGEEVDGDDGQPLGGFPQALSHVGLITAAWSIDRALNGDDEEDSRWD